MDQTQVHFSIHLIQTVSKDTTDWMFHPSILEKEEGNMYHLQVTCPSITNETTTTSTYSWNDTSVSTDNNSSSSYSRTVVQLHSVVSKSKTSLLITIDYN